MKSRASVKSHPLHPVLIVFPIAFLMGTVLTDVYSLFAGSDFFWKMGSYLVVAGILSAVVAAIPGIIDYIYTVPPDSSAKNRATKHGLLNSTMLILFVIAAFYRNDIGKFYIVGIEAFAIILLSIAGWMGGTLVHRNQIGVDPRYANAGKWREAYFEQSSTPIEIAEENELQTNQMKLLHIGNRRIVLARTENEYVAFDDRCPHKGGSLAGGSMMCGTVQCPWHGSQFKVANGEVTAGPAKEGVATYQVTVRDGNVYLNV